MTTAPERDQVHRTTTSDSTRQVLQKGEFGYPLGHLGHLTEEQSTALESFKKLAQEHKLYRPASGNDPASHDDTTMLRFLRARRFVPKDALGQFKDTEEWRQLNEIPELYDNIDINDYEETRRLYPQWTGRRDKRGIPVYVFEVAPLNSKTMSAYNKSSEKTTVITQSKKDKEKKQGKEVVPPRLLRLFALYENLTEFIMPLCSNLRDRPHSTTPISQSNNIVDISNVGLKQFWNLRSHMQDASVLATAHYPETLDRIFIVGAPSFFPTVWGWVKRWFDPITVSKIFILSEHQAYKTLSQFIEPQNIPTKYGGQLDFKFGGTPILDPAEEQHVEWASPEPQKSSQIWPRGPMKWVKKNEKEWLIMAVGSEKGKERREIVATFHPDGLPEATQSKMTERREERVNALKHVRSAEVTAETEQRHKDDMLKGNESLMTPRTERSEIFVTAPEIPADKELPPPQLEAQEELSEKLRQADLNNGSSNGTATASQTGGAAPIAEKNSSLTDQILADNPNVHATT